MCAQYVGPDAVASLTLHPQFLIAFSDRLGLTAFLARGAQMYNKELAHGVLKKLDELFPTPTTSDNLWEFQVEGFKRIPKSEWLDAIDALLKLGYIQGAQNREGARLVNAANLIITPDGQEELRKGLNPGSTDTHLASRTNLVFLSHAAKDQEIAIYLKKIIEGAIPGSDVFVSSDTEDLRPGDEWVKRIRENLRDANVLLLLASERGLNRPWVWYETGSAWSREIRMVPCCLGRVRKNGLSAPFSSYQALNVDEGPDFKSLLTEIGRELSLPVQVPETQAIVSELRALDQKAHEKDAGLLTPDEIQFRVDAANVSAKITQGHREWFGVLLTNESEETVTVREIRLIGLKGVPLAEPHMLTPESKRTLEPKARLQVDWNVNSDLAGNLVSLTSPNGWPSNTPRIMADLTIDVGCEILKRYKRCPTTRRVQVDVANRRIDEWW
jgi:hypothetical protein